MAISDPLHREKLTKNGLERLNLSSANSLCFKSKEKGIKNKELRACRANKCY